MYSGGSPYKKLLTGVGVLLFFLLIHTCERFEPDPVLLVGTDSISDITLEAASGEGIIIHMGEMDITQHGFCWSENPKPTIEQGSSNQLGPKNKAGIFQARISGLKHSTTYFLRAYATDAAGTSYGESKTFMTLSAAPPEISTLPVKDITSVSARSGGNISSNGGSEILARGVCWSSSPNPTLLGSFTEDGNGDGAFESILNGLDCGTKYYLRAYATNEVGTGYGEELEFTTPDCSPDLPEVVSSPIKDITPSSAESGGEVLSQGSSELTARGVCWSKHGIPDLSDPHTTDGTTEGKYISSITDLDCDTWYYVRAYATNSSGTAFGKLDSFQTSACPLAKPTVITSPVMDITTSTARGGGNVSYDGGAPVTAKGICWSTAQNPDLSDPHSDEGEGTAAFSSDMTGLNCATRYFVRAYATNSQGTEYGLETSFYTSACPVPPSVTTSQVVEITQTTAKVSGNVDADGGAQVTARGFCWSTSLNPTLSNSNKISGQGMGEFVEVIDGLEPGTGYYVRAFATNSAGTDYGDNLPFTTDEENPNTVTDFDGNTYPTVQIGNQTWMAENFKSTHYADGTEIPYIVSDQEWNDKAFSARAYCWYNNSIANRDAYGGLYTWMAAMNGASSSDTNPSGVQGVCPDGWHLPSDAEWKELETALGMSQADADAFGWRGTDQGGQLKEEGTDHWDDPNVGATNTSGFSARGGGLRSPSGEFKLMGHGGFFRTSTGRNSLDSWNRDIYAGSEQVYRASGNKSDGLSVRCIKD